MHCTNNNYVHTGKAYTVKLHGLDTVKPASLGLAPPGLIKQVAALSLKNIGLALAVVDTL